MRLVTMLAWLGLMLMVASLAQDSGSSRDSGFAADSTTTYYVAPDGSDANDGTSEAAPFATIQKAAEVVAPGDTVYLREGVYPIQVEFTVSGTADAPITFMSYPGEWAVLDGAGTTPYRSSDRVWITDVSWNVFKDFEVRNSPREGILVRDSSRNVFDNIVTHDNTMSGITLLDSSHNRLLNITAYGNYDEDNPNGRPGDDADGISITSGHGNYIYNCRTYDNSDDGVDTWESTGTVIDGCISHHNGRGEHGNGNGFKLGPGQDHVAGTLVRKSVAYSNRSTGFSTNGGGGVRMQNNTAFDHDGQNFAAYLDVDYSRERRNWLINNLAAGGENHFDASVQQSHNSWNLRIRNPRFASTDPERPDFLKLSPGSPAIDAGTRVGLLYYGAAPDLGAYEHREDTVRGED